MRKTSHRTGRNTPDLIFPPLFLCYLFILLPSWSSGRTLTHTFRFSTAELKTIPINDGLVLNFSDGVFPVLPGAPTLPVKGYTLPRPADAVVTGIRVLSVQFETLPGYFSVPPLPPPAILSRPGTKPAEKRHSIYNSNNPYPEQLVAITGQGLLRGKPYLSITLNPCQLLPQENRVRMIRQIEIAFEYQNQPGQDAKWQETGPMEYLIVTAPGLDSAFSLLTRWRQRTGLHTALRLIDWIMANYTGRDEAEKLRNYLKICARDSGLKWLVLGGDAELIPVRRAFAMSCSAGLHPREDSLPCDLYYSALDGTWDEDSDGVFGEVEDGVDLYPDIYVGRVPVNTPDEAHAFVEKLLIYEKGQFPVPNHLNQAIFSAAVLWHDPYTDEGIAKDLIATRSFPSRFTINKIYESRMLVTIDTVRQLLNNGFGVFNHCGHGWIDAIALSHNVCLRNPDIDNLNNTDRTGIGYSIGCWTNAFDFDAIGEHFIRHPSGGCVAYIGNSSYGWGSPGNPGFGYSDRFDARFFEELFNSTAPQIGEIFARTKLFFVPHSNEANVYRWHQFCLNLLGDPAMPVFTDTIKLLSVHKPGYLPPGQGAARIVVLDDGQPVRDAKVAIEQNGILLARAITDKIGTAILEYNDLSPEPALLTITAPNYRPLQDSLTVTPGLNLSLTTVKIVSPSWKETTDFITPGSDLALLLSIRNLGSQPTPALFFSIASNSPLLTVTRQYDTTPPIPPDSEIVTRMFLLHCSPDAGNGQTATLAITVMDSIRPLLNFPVVLLVGVPDIRITGYITDISPPDTINLFIKVTNNGWAPAKSPTGTLFRHCYPEPENCYPLLINPGIIFPDIPARESAWCLTPAQLKGSGRLRIGVNIVTAGYLFSDTLTIAGSVTGLYANFDSGTGGWSTGGENCSWQPVTRRSHSPSYAFYAGGETGTYPDNSFAWLISPEFALPPKARLTFYRWYSVPIYGVDGLYVILITGENEDTIDFIGTGGALGQGTLGITANWGKEVYDLSAYPAGESVRLKFVFVSDGDGKTGEGFYIDDILVTSSDSLFLPPAETTSVIGVFPNPLTNKTTIFYSIARPTIAEIALYDITGRRIKTLTAGEKTPGYYMVPWNGNNEKNRPVPPGVYFLQIKEAVLQPADVSVRVKNKIKLVKLK